MKVQSRFAAFLIAASAAISGCATNNQSTSTVRSTVAAAEVPTLKVSLDCGTCEVKETIPSVVVDSYNQAAARAGSRVSTDKEATLTIKEYRARSGTARFLAGAFAGKDEIKAVILYEGKTYSVEDYYLTAWLGIDSVAKNIGQLTYRHLKQP